MASTVSPDDIASVAPSSAPSSDYEYEHNFLDVSSIYNLRVLLSLTQNEVNTLRELIIFQQDPNRINIRFRNNQHAPFDDIGIFIFGHYSTFNNHPSPSLYGPPILYVGNSIRMGDLHCLIFANKHSFGQQLWLFDRGESPQHLGEPILGEELNCRLIIYRIILQWDIMSSMIFARSDYNCKSVFTRMMFISPSNGEIVTSIDADYYGIMDDLCNWGELGSSSINISTGISVATLRRASSIRFDEEIQVPVYFGESLEVEAPALSSSHVAEVVYMCVQRDCIGSTFGIGTTYFARGSGFVWNVLCYHLMSGNVDVSRITIYYPLLQWKDVDVHAPSASLCAAGYSRGGNFSDSSELPMCAGNDYGFHFLTPTQLVSSHGTPSCTFGITKKHPELLLHDGCSVGTYQVVKKYPEFMLRDAYGPSPDVIGWGAIELLPLLIGAIIPTCIADGEINVIVLIGLTRILRCRCHRVGTIYLRRLAQLTPHLLLVDVLLPQDALWGDIPGPGQADDSCARSNCHLRISCDDNGIVGINFNGDVLSSSLKYYSTYVASLVFSLPYTLHCDGKPPQDIDSGCYGFAHGDSCIPSLDSNTSYAHFSIFATAPTLRIIDRNDCSTHVHHHKMSCHYAYQNGIASSTSVIPDSFGRIIILFVSKWGVRCEVDDDDMHIDRDTSEQGATQARHRLCHSKLDLMDSILLADDDIFTPSGRVSSWDPSGIYHAVIGVDYFHFILDPLIAQRQVVLAHLTLRANLVAAEWGDMPNQDDMLKQDCLQQLAVIGVYCLRIILAPRIAQQHPSLAELLLRSESDIPVWGEVWNQDDVWSQDYLQYDDHTRNVCSSAKNIRVNFDYNASYATTSISSWMNGHARDRNIRIIWGAINDFFGFVALMLATMVVTVNTTAGVLLTCKPSLWFNSVLLNVDCATWAIIALIIGLIGDVSHVASANDGYASVDVAQNSDADDDLIVMRTTSDVTSIIIGEAQVVDSTASHELRKNGECATLNMPFVTVDTPVGIISCHIRPQDGNLQPYADRSYCGFSIQDDSRIHPGISNTSSFAPCSVHTYVIGLLHNSTMCLIRPRTTSDHCFDLDVLVTVFVMADCSGGNGRTRYLPKWGEGCEKHHDVVLTDCDSSKQGTTQDGLPYLCYSTLYCIDAIVSALREIFKPPFGIISSWGLQRHRNGIRNYSSHFYTECHLIQLRICQLVYDRCLSTIHRAPNCISSNVLGLLALHVTRHDLREKLGYDEELNADYYASLSTSDEMIGGDNDIHLKSRHCMKSYVFYTDSSYDLNDMLMSHQDVRCFTQRPSLLIGLDFLRDQCRVFTEGSNNSVPPSVKRQWFYEKPNMSMTSFPREVSIDRTNYVHTISRRQLITTSHAQTCSRTSSQYSRLRTCSKRSRQCSHLKTCDRRSRQSSRLNTCFDTSDIILPLHFLWSICLFALRICMDALDYGESILNGICWMQYGLWPIMLSCRSYFTDTRIDSWGVLRSCKFLLETCLIRYVRTGSIRMWNLLEVSTRESTTELVWQMTTSKVLSPLANRYLTSFPFNHDVN